MAQHTDLLIIGGGFAGVAAAQKLEQAGIQTLVVDKKDYFEVTYSTLRNLTSPKQLKAAPRKRYQDFLKGDFIHSGVTHLTANQAELTNGDTISFNQAIIATGSRYTSLPVAKSVASLNYNDRHKELEQANTELASAQSVLIIGGGIVGVELAGEIAHAFPEKVITLAHDHPRILNSLSPKASQKATEQLEKLGVNIEYGRRYESTDNGFIDTNSGEQASADIIYQSIGTQPNSELLQQAFRNSLNKQGYINVDAYLKLQGQTHLYAMGDVANVGEGKLGYLAIKQGEYIAKSIIRERKGKKVSTYKLNPLAVLIPVGQSQGVAQLPFGVTSWNPLINIKQKDLFISKTYKSFDVSPS